MSLLKLALKNLLRKRVRSIALILIGALAGGLIFSASTILLSVKSSLELGMKRLGADIMVAPAGYETKVQRTLLSGEPSAYYMDAKIIDRIKAVPGVHKASPQLFMTSAVLECCYAPDVLLVGYDPESDFTIKPWKRFAVEATNDDAIIGANLNYLSPEDFRFYGKQFGISSVLELTGLPYFDKTVFMTMDAARNMIEISKSASARPLNIGKDQISSVLVKVHDNYDIQKAAADIEKTLPEIKVIVTNELITAVRNDTHLALWGVFAGGTAAWVMLLAMNGLIFTIVTNERRREYGILRAMGATKKHVYRLIVSEAAILSGAGGLIGSMVGWLIISFFRRLIIVSLGNIPFTLPSPFYLCAAAVVCALLFILTGAASAMYPALRASRREPDEAIKR